MLGVLRVKSHAHWMVIQVVKECEQAMKDESEGGVEEAWATSNSYQVQTGHRHRKREKRMLIADRHNID